MLQVMGGHGGTDRPPCTDLDAKARLPGVASKKFD